MVDASERSLLDAMSRAKALELAPVSVYVLVLMIAGLAGNICVCVFYSHRPRVTPTTRLIVAVATIDTVICVLMPRNVADISLSYKFSSSVLCKSNVFVSNVTALSSLIILVTVAEFRHIAVCKPFGSQFSLRHANIAIVTAVVISLVASIPVLFTHESVAIKLTVNSTVQITGYDCNMSKKHSLKHLNLFVNILHFFIFITSSITYIVLYVKIGLSIFRYYKIKKSLNKRPVMCIKSASTTLKSDMDGDNNHIFASDNNTGFVERSNCFNTIEPNHLDEHTKHSNKNIDTENAARAGEKSDGVTYDRDVAERKEQVNNQASGVDKTEGDNFSEVAWKQTAMLFIITLIFFLSFLPYLVMNISRTLSKNKDGDADFTNWIQFCTRSYLINSDANPFVYGLFNTEFRAFVKKTFCRCCTK